MWRTLLYIYISLSLYMLALLVMQLISRACFASRTTSIHGVKNNDMHVRVACLLQMACPHLCCEEGKGNGETTTRAKEAEMLVQPRDGLVCAWTTAKVILLLSLSILSCIDVNHAQLDSHGRCMQ